MQHRNRRELPAWIGYAAAAWAVGHGLLSVYWALGGDVGTSLLSESIRDQSDSGGFALAVWGTAAAKFGAALVAMALARRLPRAPGLARLLRLAAWIGGAALSAYGALGILVTLAVVTGVIEGGDGPSGTVRRAYLLLWYPLWLLGGVLFLATARVASRRNA